MLSTMRAPRAKRACEDCNRKKRRCTHGVSESLQDPSKQVNDLPNKLDHLTTDEDNFKAMDRDYDYDYNMNKSSATKRVRKGAQSQEPLPAAAGPSSAGPSSSSVRKGPKGQEHLPYPSAGPSSSSVRKGAQSQEPFTFTAGPSSSSARKGAQSQEPFTFAAGPPAAGPSASSVRKDHQGQEPFTFAAGPFAAVPSASSARKGSQGQEQLTFGAGPSAAGPSSSSVRKGTRGQEQFTFGAGPSAAGPSSSSARKGLQGQEPLPPAAGPSSSATPKAAPVEAVFAGIPTTVPSPEDPVNMYDVEEFLSNLEVIKGIAKPPGDFYTAEDKLLSILGKWNSVYTIAQNPAANIAESRGLEVGRNLANLAIFSKREGLLKHLLEYFKLLEVKAEENKRAFTAKDHEEYAEFGHISWVYMQLSQACFAKYVCNGVTEAAHAGSVFDRKEEKARKARLEAEMPF